MTKRLYWTQRYERITSPYNLEANTSLNGVYTASAFLNNQFADWNKAWLTNVIDQQIPEEAYTGEIAPWVPKLTRFIMCEYNENYVDPVELQRSLENVGARFNIDVLTIEEACEWVRNNTSLIEVAQWKFLISPESEMMGEIIPAIYLEIN